MLKAGRQIRACSSILILVIVAIVIFSGNSRNSQFSQNRFRRSAAEGTTNTTVEKKKSFYDPKVWIASAISVFIISAVGLLGVAVVPLVQKVFYNKIIQYLVALAVGSLTGDAFLHLIPHAILGEHKEAESNEPKQPGESEKMNEELVSVFKGLVALSGVYFFFFAEKFLSMISEYRAEKRAEEEERQRQLKDPRRSELRRLSAMQISNTVPSNRRGSHLGNPKDSAMFRRLSKAVGNEDEEGGIIMTGLSGRAMKSLDNLIRFAELDVPEDQMVSAGLLPPGGGSHLTVPGITVSYQAPKEEEEDQSGEIKLMVPSPVSNEREDKTPEDEKKPITNTSHKVIINDDKRPSTDTTHTDEDDKKEGHGHSHSHDSPNVEVKDKKEGHGHGHSHEVPASIAAVAWMVILGDGLHNFSDGLAIGAAFADKISGGISTAVAVFCHELPHELGDFAVLLKTGMSVKQALFYNIVSSILCFLGMLIGIALHNVESASYWIFAVTAGTFVYIALVDMLPELNSAEVRPGESRIAHFFIQNFGLATGVGVMLLIAIYEESIKSMLD